MKLPGFAERVEIVEIVAVEVGWPKDKSLQMVIRRCYPLNVGLTPRKRPFMSLFFRSIEYPVPIRAVIDEMFVKIQGKQQYK